MKKLTALILVCLLCLAGTALAAEWPDGLSPAKPSNLKPEVDLSETIGYWLPYPRSGLPAEVFCDVLEMYMPNPDIALGEGTATLWNADGKVCEVDFTNPDQVELRPLEETELEDMHWGSGVCLEMYLPISLKFDEDYYVTMDEGVLTSNGGKVKSMQIPYSDKMDITKQYWTPSVTGDYGIGGLYYCTPVAEEETDEPVEVDEVVEEPCSDPKYNPEQGDRVFFDVVLGGDAKVAVMNSENGSVYFDSVEYTETGRVSGTVVGEDVSWGVVFLDENGDVLDYISMESQSDGAEE